MNNNESCAVDYLYHTRDCEFAKRMANATNGELSDVALMIAQNEFPICAPRSASDPRWSPMTTETKSTVVFSFIELNFFYLYF